MDSLQDHHGEVFCFGMTGGDGPLNANRGFHYASIAGIITTVRGIVDIEMKLIKYNLRINVDDNRLSREDRIVIANKAAQRLGRMARGIPKNYTPEERERRAEVMRKINEKRRKK